MEVGKGLVEKKGGNPNDAVIQIAETENVPVTKEINGSPSSSKKFNPSSLNTHEIKPAETPGQSSTRRKLASRFDEPHESDDAKSVEGNAELTPRSPTLESPGDDEEVVRKVKKKEKKGNKIKKILVAMELIAFVCVMGLLIASLTVNKLKNHRIWGELALWNWCVLVLVVFCGRLVTTWLMIALIFLIEKNFKLKLMVLYCVDGLRRSAKAFIWLVLVLLSWGLLVERGVDRSKETRKIINYITRGLVACLVGTVLWMIKTYSFKLLAASRLSNRFFDQIQEAMFNKYVISTISGPPLMEWSFRIMDRKIGKEKEKEEEEMIHHVSGKRKKMKKISALTMENLIDHISSTNLSTDQIWDELDDQPTEREIENEMEARAAAYHIFRNVAQPGSAYIDGDDLLRFFIKEEVDLIIPLLETEEIGKISRSDLTKWMVNVYKKCTSLAHYLNNSKEAMEELNNLFTGIVVVLIIIVWLLIVGLLTTKALLLILSQLVLAVFLFGNTAKNVFEAIIFLFVTHPFDVGDRCVIDGVQMVVEEMHILTTTFMRYDSEKIFYPNSVLATKPISNFYRSTVDMRDAVEFGIDVFTPVEKIGCLRSKISSYFEMNPLHWSPKHSVVVKQIMDEKMIMGLYVTHIIIFENYEEKINRRSELLLELKRIFEEVGIRIYHVLPQEVRVGNVGSTTTSAVTRPEN